MMIERRTWNHDDEDGMKTMDVMVVVIRRWCCDAWMVVLTTTTLS